MIVRRADVQAGIISLLLVAVVASSFLRLVHGSQATDERGAVAGARHVSLASPFTPTQATPPPIRLSDREPGANARSMYVVDVESGYPLYAFNADQSVPIASTTKLMTAVIATERYQLSEVATVSRQAALTNGSGIGLVVDEQISVDALMKALLIQSGNDAAMTLAEHMGLDTFVQRMNEKAAELGMTATTYKDPAGLNDEGRSSARDLGIIAAYALRNEVIQGVVRITNATVQSDDLKYSHELETSNRLIKSDNPLYLPEVTGLKTGFTPDAGHCLVASATHNGHQIVSVVLGTNDQSADASARESRKLLTLAFDTFQWSE